MPKHKPITQSQIARKARNDRLTGPARESGPYPPPKR